MRKMHIFAREHGFTLVELMVVILIVGVLISIATLSFVFSISRTKESVCEANRRTIKGALSEYLAINNYYPENLSDLFPDYISSQKALFCSVTGNAFIYTPNAA